MNPKLSLLFLSATAHAIVVPLSGAVLRYRAHSGPTTARSGVLRVLRRLYESQGWTGLLKGVVPTFLGILIFRGCLLVVKVHPTFPLMVMAAPQMSLIESPFFILISAMIDVPAQIILVRSTLIPYVIPWTPNPIRALRLLFSPSERTAPWIIYFTPGLFFTTIFQHAAQFIIIRISFLLGGVIWGHWYKSPSASSPGYSAYEAHLIGLSIESPRLFTSLAVLAILSLLLGFFAYTVLLTPLKVIGIRLAAQRNWIDDERDQVAESDEGEHYGLEIYESDEEIVSINPSTSPYLGFLDCFHRIVENEGWRALYRAWWFSIVSQIVVLVLWMS